MKASEKIKELNAKSAEELKAQKIDLLKRELGN